MYQIDQSGKIEDTSKNTVLAAANSGKWAVILVAKDKRRLQEIFRRQGMPQLFVDAVFATALYHLIKLIPQVGRVCVDTEYLGHTKTITKMLENLSEGKTSIEWTFIGKSSTAHDVAYKVLKGQIKIGKRLKVGVIRKEAIKIAGGYLKTGLSPANRHSAPAYDRILAKNKKKSRVNKNGWRPKPSPGNP